MDEIIYNGKLARVPLGAPFSLNLTDYDAFREDMRLAGISVKELAEALGRNVGAVYGWKQTRVPEYAKAWVQLQLEIKTLKRDMSGEVDD